MKHIVLGAGPLGVALAGQIHDRGDEVMLVSIMGNPAYDMPGTQAEAVDGTDAQALAGICAGADVVYLSLNAHYVDWHRLYPPRLAATLEAARSTGTRLIYHDNMYPYGPSDEPLTESTPPTARTRKGLLRASMARAFTQAVDTGQMQGAIGRSADMYGPGALNSSFNSTLGERHFYPMLAGKPVTVLGNVDRPHTYSYVPDVAAGLVTLGTNDRALGDLWHLPSAPTLSHRELLGVAFDVADRKPRLRSSALSPLFVRMIGAFQADVGEVAEMLYQFQRPLIVSHDKFADAFGATVTPHRQALEETIAWYRSTSRLRADSAEKSTV